MSASRSLVCLIFTQLCFAIVLYGQDEPTKEQPSPRIGLTLSGGGAKGFLHIGVLKVLEEVQMPIDYITGTSMGALVGGLYAAGYSTEMLTELSLNMDWVDLFSDEIRRRNIPMDEKEFDGLYLITLPIFERSLGLPAGVVAGHRVSLLLNNLLWAYPGERDFSTFPIPFTAIATDIETGELVLLNEGFLSDAIRASISIPSALMPHQINGRMLVDGGVVRNLPVEEAFDMGADIVIAANVTAPLKKVDQLRSIVDILDQTITFQIKSSVRQSRDKADILIESDDAIQFSVTDFDDALEIIAFGEAATRLHYDELKALADSINTLRGRTPTYPTLPDMNQQFYVSDIEVNGLQNIRRQQILSRVNIEPNQFVTREMINEAIEYIYGMMFFDKVIYRLHPSDRAANAYTLEIQVSEKIQNQFRFGFNYTNIQNAALLFNLTLRNLFQPGSVFRLNIKLADEPFVDVRYFRHLNIEENLAFSLRGLYRQQKIDVFSRSGNRNAQFLTNSLILEGMLLPVTTNKLLGGIGLRQEFFDVSLRVGSLDLPGSTSSITQPFFRIEYDNFDRLNFTQRGHNIEFEASQSVNFFNNSLNFFKTHFRWQGFFQVNTNVVILGGAKVGIATRSELPLHQQFFLGGYPDLAGFRNYELGSNAVRKISTGVQYQFIRNNFAEFRTNIASGDDLNQFNFKDNPLYVGWSVGYGLNSLIGPIRFNISTSQRNPFMAVYSVGVKF